MRVTLNGEGRDFEAGLGVEGMLRELGLWDGVGGVERRAAVERNGEIVPRSMWGEVELEEGDELEVVHIVGGGLAVGGGLLLGGREYGSRLIVGTGKYESFELTASAIAASGAQLVTVAVRRVNVTDATRPRLTDYVSPSEYTYLPNSAGCSTATEALRVFRLAREAGGWDLVKVEVIGDEKTLYPDMLETLQATERLAQEGFLPLPYCTDDPLMAKRLESAGAVGVMPLGAPIGSGLGIRNPLNIRLVVEGSGVPVLVDAGVGTASDVAVAMELGCDGVLVNTAIAEAKDPVLMARAMAMGVEAGRAAWEAGRMGRRLYGSASSPLEGALGGLLGS